MYENGVPEKLISEKSGHRSLKALRTYEHISKTQEKVAGECIRSEKMFYVSEAVTEARYSEKNKPNEEEPRLIQHFSGLQNCTFNFYKTS